MNVVTVKKGDRMPALTMQLKDVTSGAALDLTSASGVTFRMRLPAAAPGVYKASGAGSIVTAASGIVSYPWGATDTDTVGDFAGEWVVTWPTSLPQTVPTSGFVQVRVVASLA
jgi:hypothetical protein